MTARLIFPITADSVRFWSERAYPSNHRFLSGVVTISSTGYSLEGKRATDVTILRKALSTSAGGGRFLICPGQNGLVRDGHGKYGRYCNEAANLNLGFGASHTPSHHRTYRTLHVGRLSCQKES